MRVKTLLKVIYYNFGRGRFTSNSVLKSLPYYEVYPTQRNAIYVCIHRCWKMGLLSREKDFGNSYEYQITDWGIRYLEEGSQYRDDEVQLKLLRYIVLGDNWHDKQWALNKLVPRLLRRFLPGRRAQDINPLLDIPEICDQATELLKRRIYDETLQALLDQEGDIITQCSQDLQILVLSIHLLAQFGLHHYLKHIQDYKFSQSKILLGAIFELLTYDPPKHVMIYNFRGDNKMKAFHKPSVERPTLEDIIDLRSHLQKVVDKLRVVNDFMRSSPLS